MKIVYTLIITVTLWILQISGNTRTRPGTCTAGEPCIFNCDDCGGGTLICAAATTCEIYCNRPDSCKNSRIEANGADHLLVYCHGKTSCGDSTIDANSADYLVVFCFGVDSCKNSRIDAAKLADVICEGKTSCGDSTIDANSAANLDVFCFGVDSCKNSRIDAAKSTDVICEGKTSCGDSTIDANGADELWVVCIGVDSCKGNTDIDCGTADCSIACLKSTSCEDAYVDASEANGFHCGPTSNCKKLKFGTGGDSGGDSGADSDEAAARSIGSRLSDGENNDNNTYKQKIIISFSRDAMINIWAVVIGFLFVNLVIAYCYCFRGKNKRATFNDEIGTKI